MFDVFKTDDIPFMARPMYHAEWRHTLGWGVFAGMVEGNTSSIVAAKTFGASPFVVTAVWATPMLANVLSLFWSAVIPGRRRIPLFVAAASAAMFCFMSIGLNPAGSTASGWIFAAQIALARVFLGATVNIRTSIWAANYPEYCRARITARIQSLRFGTALAATAFVSLLFNDDPLHYRWLYPLVGVVGIVALVPLRRMRVRGERRERARHAARAAEHRGFRANLVQALHILRTDRGFARYCTAQFFLGSANFMVDPVLLLVLTTRLRFDYFTSSVVMDLLPNIILLASVPIWARHFDRHGVLRFRVSNTVYWLSSTLVAAGALWMLECGVAQWSVIAALVVSRMINGVGRGGGSIAWNLGHLHFADRSNADLYMGIHVGLTGIRGLIMPFVASALYLHVGWVSLAVAAALNVVAMVSFTRLASLEQRENSTEVV